MLVCSKCNAALNNPEFKTAHRSALESYQLVLRRVLQERHERQAASGSRRRSLQGSLGIAGTKKNVS